MNTTRPAGMLASTYTRGCPERRSACEPSSDASVLIVTSGIRDQGSGIRDQRSGEVPRSSSPESRIPNPELPMSLQIGHRIERFFGFRMVALRVLRFAL